MGDAMLSTAYLFWQQVPFIIIIILEKNTPQIISTKALACIQLVS